MSSFDDLPETDDACTVEPNMTIVVGLAVRDGCVLVADKLGINQKTGTRVEEEEKILQVGANCVIGMAGAGDVTKEILSSCGFLDSTDPPRLLAQRIGNAFRRHRLGKTTVPQWWAQDEPLFSASAQQWEGPPNLLTLIAGYQDGPVLLALNPGFGFAACDVAPGSAIGVPEWTLPIINSLCKRKGWEAKSIEDAAFVGVFCAHVTSRFASLVGASFDVWTITGDGACKMRVSRVQQLTHRAKSLLDDWLGQILPSGASN